ncbi:secreted protein [Beggiatoa sp. PS]|nr:secreted protein [Beggiatoa sp. PS]
MMKKILLLLLCGCFISCTTAPPKEGPSVKHGFSTALAGLGHLLLSPIQIAAGLLEGIASVPYYLSTSLQEINQGLIAAQADITLDDTYESAYGKRLSQVPASGETGVIFRRMKHATQFFQTVLKQYGIAESNHYILASIEEDSRQYTLLAVLYRSFKTIEVMDKHDGQRIRSFSLTDRLFYEPYAQDSKGNRLDTVIDWAALPLDAIQTQKAQAIFITLAANSVLNDKKTPNYWDIERRWLEGQAHEIIEQHASEMNRRMGI